MGTVIALHNAPVATPPSPPLNPSRSKEGVMYKGPEQLLATNKEALETFVEFAGIAAAGAEKLLDVQVKIAKAVFADTVKHAKTIAAAKDVQELAEIQNSVV